jgi:hypothetical protein
MRPLLASAIVVSTALVACAGGVQRPDPNIAAAQWMLSLNQTIETPSFPANGGTLVETSIDGYKTAVYVIGAVKGQTLTVQLDSESPNVYFDVLETGLGGGSKKIFSTEAACRGARIRAQSDTTYIIRPFLASALADAGATARYTLCINRCEEGMGNAACRWTQGDLDGV